MRDKEFPPLELETESQQVLGNHWPHLLGLQMGAPGSEEERDGPRSHSQDRQSQDQNPGKVQRKSQIFLDPLLSREKGKKEKEKDPFSLGCSNLEK